MNIGDLVEFCRCAQEGKFGIISHACEPSDLAMANPELRLYWVLCDVGIQCFTGNQLVSR
jgi:hypothetical protein